MELSLNISLNAHDVEMLSRADIRIIMINAYRNGTFNQIKRQGMKILNSTTSIAFLVGKQQAAIESNTKYWGIEQNDFPILRELKLLYWNDWEKLLNEIQSKAFSTIDLKTMRSFLSRGELISQTAVWTSYNRGKMSLWDDEFFTGKDKGVLEARYKYKGEYMIRIKTDSATCSICMDIASDVGLSSNLDIIPQPPFHPNCRCEPVAIPTVELVKQQKRFVKKSMKDKTPEQKRTIKKNKAKALQRSQRFLYPKGL